MVCCEEILLNEGNVLMPEPGYTLDLQLLINFKTDNGTSYGILVVLHTDNVNLDITTITTKTFIHLICFIRVHFSEKNDIDRCR